MFVSGWIIALVVAAFWIMERDSKRTLKDTEEVYKQDLKSAHQTILEMQKVGSEAEKAQRATEAQLQECRGCYEAWMTQAEKLQAANDAWKLTYEQHVPPLQAAYTDALKLLRIADEGLFNAHMVAFRSPDVSAITEQVNTPACEAN